MSDFSDLEERISELRGDLNDLERLTLEFRGELNRVKEREPVETFGRNFRIGMFLLSLAFVAVAGHWLLAVVGYFALKDIVFRKDSTLKAAIPHCLLTRSSRRHAACILI